ncbi:MAG TPA: hypothetical protein VIW73_13595 [Candidatus Cybelea sp.]
MSFRMYEGIFSGAAIVAFLATGCSSQSSVSTMPSGATATQSRALGISASPAGGGILQQLKKQVVIGSTIDPVYGQLNPYGLDVAKRTSGAFKKGDLAVCNFNDNTNTQGTGYTIVALHPKPGSTPTLVTADPTNLVGCNAIALGPDDKIYAAAFASNDNPIYSSSGSLITNLSGSPFNHPFGQIFAQREGGSPADDGAGSAVYESNAADGSIVRINVPSLTSEVIATGFPVNGGPPGSILGPSGLQYDPGHDRLFVVDGDNNSVTTITGVSGMHHECLKVRARGTRFEGSCASRTRVLYSGAPLNGPISSALLFNGTLVVGNTLDPSGQNLMIAISPGGHVEDIRNVDTGAGGAIFGMVATGEDAQDTKIYFNDDNANNLQVLER